MATTELVDRETGEITERETPGVRVDPRFVQLRQGRPFVSYAGLLDLLHQRSKGFFSIDTLVVQLPTEENGRTAVCTARVRVFDDQNLDVVTLETSGIGDADPGNCTPAMRGHLLRLAETRAKARALRDAVNVGMAALEELGPDEPVVAPAPPAASPPVERILIEGTAYTRPQVEAAYRKRVEQAKAAGLAMGEVATVPIERTPLAILAGKSQEIKRRLEAKGQGSSGK